MDRTIFFDGQSIGADDLRETNNRLIANIKKRTIDFFSKGVIGSKNALFVQNGANNTVKILPFVAYTQSGERVYVYKEIDNLALDISEETTDPLFKYRLRHQGSLPSSDFGWLPDEAYTIYVNYIEKGANPKAQETTGIFYPTRVNSGFEFYAIPTSVTVDINTTDMVRLCQVTFDGTQLNIQTTGFLQFATINASRIYTAEGASTPVSYNPYTQVSIQDHIMCLGSGTPTVKNPHGYTPEDLGFDVVSVQGHEKRMHSAGITGTTQARESVNSALYTMINSRSATWDNIKLFNLGTNEYLQSNGYWLSALNVEDVGDQNEVYIQFTYNNNIAPTPLPNGLYYIGVTPENGTIVIGSSISNPSNYTIDITKESTGETLVATAQLIDYNTYKNLGVFDIATFTWDSTLTPNKPATNIPSGDFSRSNFTTKTDDRLFGYTSPLDLVTTKDLFNNNILKFPYRVIADELYLSSGVKLDGTTTLADGAIQGFQLNYVAQNIVQVTPGKCRDSQNQVDIILNQAITKIIDEDWETNNGTTTGGLSNQSGNMGSPWLNSSDLTIGLHVFVIMTAQGDVDVAIDTTPNGANINNYSPVGSYIYKRRVGSLFIRPDYSTGGSSITLPYVTVEENSGLWVYYKTRYTLPSGYYSSNKWTKAGVPPGSTEDGIIFRGHFNATLSANRNFYTSLISAPFTLSGNSVFDVHMSDQSLYSSAQDTVYCLGYYDPRTK